jgi:hypothetical protein
MFVLVCLLSLLVSAFEHASRREAPAVAELDLDAILNVLLSSSSTRFRTPLCGHTRSAPFGA